MKCFGTFCLEAVLLTSCLWLKHLLSDYMSHEMFIHVYFTLKLVVKRKG